jgi:hypothetical protein
MTKYTLLCRRCGEDTDCSPDLTKMSAEAAALVAEEWLCSDCLDRMEAAEEAGAVAKNVANVLGA